ncbi:MAG TPA: DUF6754 domain-containing protein, partial [Candidatus Mcinerneyibacterium sp.]|nr:DUF6754 domain-containing protein [Candidatus Mcinerneyibacterium sp.]
MKKIIFIFIIITILISPIFSEKTENNEFDEFDPKARVKIIDKPQDEGTHVYVEFKPLNKPDEVKYYLLEVYNKKADSEELVSSFKIENKGKSLRFSSTLEDSTYSPWPKSRTALIKAYSSNKKGEKLNQFVSKTMKTNYSWFNINKLSAFLGVVIFLILVYIFIKKARTGTKFFIRKIPGLDAVDSAVGRATEMGKPIYYVPGIGTTSQIATLASLNILAPITRKVAKFSTPLKVPNRDPVVMSIAQDVVQEAYMAEGRPDLFDSNDVFFLTRQQFAFAGSVSGLFKREKPGAVFLLGKFYAESLIFAETANDVGAIQIAGTDSVSQIPFFIAACDYTLIGEELFAASGYLSRDPLIVGTTKAQDYLKALLIILLFIGIILNIFDIDIITD